MKSIHKNAIVGDGRNLLSRLFLTLLIMLVGQSAFAQSKQVTGVVKDATGITVIGASVVEKGTTNGTITDFDGNFTLTVAENAVLEISYVGFATQEIPVSGKTSFVITLSEDAEMLEEKKADNKNEENE